MANITRKIGLSLGADICWPICFEELLKKLDLNLPIDGTLSQPSLDSSGVRQVVAELGTQAVQQTAENYLQKQLGKGIDKLFGR